MPSPPQKHDFPVTRWTLVRKAVVEKNENAFSALSSLCEIYYAPLLGVIRARGYGPADAEDLRQEFFVRLLERGEFRNALEKQVKLRAFLLHELKWFLMDHYRHSIAGKRDSRKNTPLDEATLDGADALDGQDGSLPDTEYDLGWRKALLEEGMRKASLRWEQLRQANGSLLSFEILAPFLDGGSDESQRIAAERLGINRNSITRDVPALRKELRKIIERLVEDTLANPSPDAVREELKALKLMK